MLDILPEIADALASGSPVVALESTLITHGLPYPDNVETARRLEQIVRDEGAVPATIAVIDGRIKIGLDDAALDYIGQEKGIRKLNAADISLAVSQKQSGGTTVAGTMYCAEKAGIKIFATGGIGGVHRGAEQSFDISQDLEAFTRYNVAVVTAGAKAILDLPKTLEYLETKAVPVIGFGTDKFPAFWSRSSGLALQWRCDSPENAAHIMKTREGMKEQGGIIIANPIPEEQSLPHDKMEDIIEQALKDATAKGVSGKAVTPFLLKRVRQLSEGLSLTPNITLLENNARLAAQIAVKYSGL